MRCCNRLAPALIALALGVASVGATAQTRAYSDLGRTPTPEEIVAWGISIDPQGKGLPPESGTPKEGAAIYAKKCTACHGPAGAGSPSAPALAGGKGTISALQPVRTIGSYWPFATTIWDYINRAMPPGQGGSLSAHEVYALTAFLLYVNDIVPEGAELDARSLPQVRMPNRDGFVPSRVEDIPNTQRSCRFGHCP